MIVLVLLALALTSSGAAAKRRVMDAEKSHYDPPEHTCAYHQQKVCPSNGGRYQHFNREVRCLHKQMYELPAWCRAPIKAMWRCVDDMDHFCHDLSEKQTALCMNHHLDEVSEHCKSSFYFRPIHEHHGRATDHYNEHYNEHRALEEKFRQEEAEMEQKRRESQSRSIQADPQDL